MRDVLGDGTNENEDEIITTQSAWRMLLDLTIEMGGCE